MTSHKVGPFDADYPSEAQTLKDANAIDRASRPCGQHLGFCNA